MHSAHQPVVPRFNKSPDRSRNRHARYSDAAASIAKGIEHVKAVKNDLEVVAIEDRKATDVSDKDITSQVEARFSKATQLTEIDVRTDGGLVTLTGAAPSIGASARASELARGVPGVRAVRNELTYDSARRDRSSSPGSR